MQVHANKRALICVPYRNVANKRIFLFELAQNMVCGLHKERVEVAVFAQDRFVEH